MEKTLSEASLTYAVERGELLVNGSRLAVSSQCIRLCLERHGLDPRANHKRLPLQVARHNLRISSFVLTFALGRHVDQVTFQRRYPR